MATRKSTKVRLALLIDCVMQGSSTRNHCYRL